MSPETGVLQQEGHGVARLRATATAERSSSLSAMAPMRGPGRFPFLVQPVERYHLDLALKPIRDDASISSRHSVKQGAPTHDGKRQGKREATSCQHSVRRDKSPWESPKWVKQARKDLCRGSLERKRDRQNAGIVAHQASHDGPADIYRCSIPGPEGDKIALYGLSTKALTDDVARTKAFSYLTTKANTFLKP